MMLSLLLLDASDLSLLSQSSQVGAAASAISSNLNTLKGCNTNGRSRMTPLANSSVSYLARGSTVDERGPPFKGLYVVGRGGFLKGGNSEFKLRRRRSSHTMCMAGMAEKNSITNGQNTEPTTLHATSQPGAAVESSMSKFRTASNKLRTMSFLSPTLSAGTTYN